MKAPKPDTFPLKIKKGHAVATIYKGTNRGRDLFTLSYVAPSGRVRNTFADLGEAKREADSALAKLVAGDFQALKLTGRDAQLFVAATEALKPCGVSIDIACREFAQAFDVLGFDGIIEAARHYKATVANGLPDVLVTDAVDRFYLDRKTNGSSPKHLKDIRNYLGAVDSDWPRRDETKPRGGFAGAFGSCLLRALTTDQLSPYFAGLKVGPTARNNRRRMIATLFNFGKEQGWLKKNETTAADAIGTVKIKRKRGSIAIFTPHEAEAMLSVAVPRYRNYLALILFGGLRADEICDDLKAPGQKSAGQLRWEDIDFKRNRIVVPDEVTKTIERKIPLQPNLRAWLELTPANERTGFIYEVKSQYDRKVTCKLSGVAWKPNAHRHSYASYRLDQTKSAAQVSLEMGNSPKVVFKHYSELVDDEETVLYWNIYPKKAPADGKIVPMSPDHDAVIDKDRRDERELAALATR